MYTRITDSRDKLYPTRIALKVESDRVVRLPVYVQNISDGIIGNLKLEGKVLAGQKVIQDLTFERETYENVMPGVCCLFMDELVMPKHDVTISLTSYHWMLRPMVEGDVRQYGDWIKDSERYYQIEAILPVPPPPEFRDIVMSFGD